VHLLKTSDASVDEVATRIGYADGATLRALLRRRLNVGVKELRKGATSRKLSAASELPPSRMSP
jgi:transcriptional regulator GlxA family with amidase domain